MGGMSGGGFFSQSEAESEEAMSSDYLRDVGTPMSMEIPEWATSMTEEFMRSMFGSEYYDQLRDYEEYQGQDHKQRDKLRKKLARAKERLAMYESRAEARRASGRNSSSDERQADHWRNKVAEYTQRLETYEMEAPMREGPSPYQTAVEEVYGGTRLSMEDILRYMESQQNLIPDATAAAAGEYSDLMSTMIDQSLSGESVIPQIGLPDTGFAGLLDRLTSPVSIGLQGHGGMSFVPRGAAEALREVFAGRQGALDQLQGWGVEREEADLRPAYSQYEHGLKPLQYALDMSQQMPESGSLLQMLSGLRGMWAPVGETAMQLGGQVPIISESESVTGSASAESESFGAGLSGSIGGS